MPLIKEALETIKLGIAFNSFTGCQIGTFFQQ